MPNTNGRRTQQERREETERRVIEAAVELIARNGSRSMSLAEVGRLAGYSHGIVNHAFGSKQGLLSAVVAHAQHIFDPPISESRGLEQLLTTMSGYLRSLRDRAPTGQAFLMLWSEAIASDPLLTPLFAERDAWFRHELSNYLRRGVEDGSIRDDVDPDLHAIALVGLLRGIGMQLVGAIDEAPIDAITEQTISTLRRGLAAPRRSPRRRQ